MINKTLQSNPVAAQSPEENDNLVDQQRTANEAAFEVNNAQIVTHTTGPLVPLGDQHSIALKAIPKIIMGDPRYPGGPKIGIFIKNQTTMDEFIRRLNEAAPPAEFDYFGYSYDSNEARLVINTAFEEEKLYFFRDDIFPTNPQFKKLFLGLVDEDEALLEGLVKRKVLSREEIDEFLTHARKVMID